MPWHISSPNFFSVYILKILFSFQFLSLCTFFNIIFCFLIVFPVYIFQSRILFHLSRLRFPRKVFFYKVYTLKNFILFSNFSPCTYLKNFILFSDFFLCVHTSKFYFVSRFFSSVHSENFFFPYEKNLENQIFRFM